MKQKILLIVVTSMLFVMTVSSSALAAWYVVTIQKVGGSDSGGRVMVTDTKGAFSGMWFNITGNNADQLYATVLTAVALNKKLSIRVDVLSNFSDLGACYLID